MTEITIQTDFNTNEVENVLCGMMTYMDELLSIIEKQPDADQFSLNELAQKGKVYKRIIVQIRSGMQLTNFSENEVDDTTGHKLLGEHGKILVIGGQEIGINVMQGIAKDFGFNKRDFEFVDYDKAKDYANRVCRNGKFKAVILGECPHKISGGGSYSSAVEMFKNEEGMPFAVDARSKSGKLKMTKVSFREALGSVVENLRFICA